MVWELIAGVIRGVGSIVLLWKGIHRKFNPMEREKALQAGIDGAQAEEGKLPLEERLFSRDYYNLIGKFRIDGFLKEVLQPKEGEDELQKRLYPKGIPDVPVLVERFKGVAAEKNPRIDLREGRIDPWLKEFKRAYVQNTNINSAFKAAKKNYCEQLERMCENVQFAGVAVEGQEKDKYALLTQIFVIPDVEEMQDRSSSWLAEESPEESAQRRGQKAVSGTVTNPRPVPENSAAGCAGCGENNFNELLCHEASPGKTSRFGISPRGLVADFDPDAGFGEGLDRRFP